MFGKAVERAESSWSAGLLASARIVEAGVAHVLVRCARRLHAGFVRWVESGRILQRERARQMLEDPRVRAEIEAATARASRDACEIEQPAPESGERHPSGRTIRASKPTRTAA